ncbi:hypothetical protein [Salinicola endophyticus]|uniref:Phage tail protein n=1 Tax=Salinicola endophyticus TaxID=1949083 RepID=A0AB74UG36_9GAMM
MAIVFTITDAGRAALIDADHDGTNALTISEIGLGGERYAPAKDQTDLRAPIKRLDTIAGRAVAADTLHVTVQDESSDAYAVGEIGLFTDAGVLFAVYSQSDWIIEKAAPATLLLATDLVVESLDVSSITFGDAAFLNPPATTEVAGVLEIATQAEVDAGSDARRGVVPRTLKAFIDKVLAAYATVKQLTDHAASRDHPAASTYQQGMIELATYAEVRDGVDHARAVTPAGLNARTATTTSTGLIEKATEDEAKTGASGVYPDAAGVRLAFEQYGLGLKAGLPYPSSSINDHVANGIYRVSSSVSGYGNNSGASLIAAAWDDSNWGKILIDGGGQEANKPLNVVVFAKNFGHLRTPAKLWHDGNDGAGSGLDADTLDGMQGSEYRNAGSLNAGTLPTARLSGSYDIDITGDARTLRGLKPADFVTASYGMATNMRHDQYTSWLDYDEPGDTSQGIRSYVRDGVLNLTAAPNETHAIRVRIQGADVWHSGNDGAGSGLDADKLDGLESSAFLRSDETTVWRRGDAGLRLTTSGDKAYIQSGYGEDANGTSSPLLFTGWYGTASPLVRFITDAVQFDTGNVTAAGNKMWHAGNQGSGSGLDADKLDGLHGSEYRNAGNLNAGTLPKARLSGSYDIDITGDARTLGGNYPGNFVASSSGVANNISLSRYFSLLDYDEPGDTEQGVRAYVRDGAINLNPAGNEQHPIRLVVQGSDVWHAGNDGPGSGLDADKLDGMQGWEYRNAGNLNAGTLPTARLGNGASDRDWVLGHIGNAGGYVVGTYAFAYYGAQVKTSDIISGGSLTASSISQDANGTLTTTDTGTRLPGTWRACGGGDVVSVQRVLTLFRRIS